MSAASPAESALLRLLGVRHPIVQAPMAGGWTTPELVAAVSNAGALGALAAARLTTPQLEEALARVRALTTRPFAVNFLLAAPAPPPRDTQAMDAVLDRLRAAHGLPPRAARPAAPPASAIDEQLGLVLAAGVPVVSFAMGDPGDRVARVQAAGAVAVGTATTVDEAERLAARGVDAIVAQGAEAGGHRGTFDVGAAGEVPLVGTLVLVPAVVDAVRVPVLASGGIMDGRGLVAALALGAGGAQLGTRFLLARESGAYPAYRRALLAARETDTAVTRAISGRPARALRNALVDAIAAAERDEGVAPLPYPHQGLASGDLYEAARARDDAALAPLLAGQGLRLARAEQSADAIVAELVEERARIVAALAR